MERKVDGNSKIPFSRKLPKNGPQVLAKFQENRMRGKSQGEIFIAAGIPRGELHVETRHRKLLCISEKTSSGVGWSSFCVTPLHSAYSESVGERRDKRNPAIRRELHYLYVTPRFVCVVWDKFGDA